MRRFKIVTSAELGPPPPRQGDEGADPPQQVQQFFSNQSRFWPRKTLLDNHLIKGSAEQGEEAEQGDGEVQPGDEPQVEKFATWRVDFDPSFSAGRR